MMSPNCKMFENHISKHWHYPSPHVTKSVFFLSHIFEIIKRSFLVTEFGYLMSLLCYENADLFLIQGHFSYVESYSIWCLKFRATKIIWGLIFICPKNVF